MQAWNDFNVDEWCAIAPDRFIPMTLLPLWDVELCVAEIHRTAAKGSKCIGSPRTPFPGLAVISYRPLGSGVRCRGRARHAVDDALRHVGVSRR